MSSVATAFSGTNPEAQAAVDNYTRAYVWNISQESRAAIASIVRRAIAEGTEPYEAAKLIESVIGLNRQQALAVASYRAELIRSGLSPDRVALLVNIYSERKLIERALMIARTEIMAALNEGSLEAYRRAVREGLLTNPMKQWITTPDEKLCPQCEPLDDEEVPLEMPFSSGDMRPPLHPNCRCTFSVTDGPATIPSGL